MTEQPPSTITLIIKKLDENNFRGHKILVTIFALLIFYFWYQPLAYSGQCERHGLLFLETLHGNLSFFRLRFAYQEMADATPWLIFACVFLTFSVWAKLRRLTILTSLCLSLGLALPFLQASMSSRICSTWFIVGMFAMSIACCVISIYLNKVYKKNH